MNSLGLIVGLLLATAIAVAAYRVRALTSGGALAAAVTGTAAMAAGWTWGVLLVVYFVTSTLLSRHRAAIKRARVAGITAKEGPRDALQVLANGGFFMVCALANALQPSALWAAAGVGALAASAADTWATEIGVAAGWAPRSILTWKPVPVGSSGGVTLPGILGGVAGAGTIGLSSRALGFPDVAVASAIIGGTIGCVLDSLVGATVQARLWCASCAAQTEQRVHRCGATTVHRGGFGWLDNDGVNAMTTVAGGIIGTAAGFALRG